MFSEPPKSTLQPQVPTVHSQANCINSRTAPSTSRPIRPWNSSSKGHQHPRIHTTWIQRYNLQNTIFRPYNSHCMTTVKIVQPTSPTSPKRDATVEVHSWSPSLKITYGHASISIQKKRTSCASPSTRSQVTWSPLRASTVTPSLRSSTSKPTMLSRAACSLRRTGSRSRSE